MPPIERRVALRGFGDVGQALARSLTRDPDPTLQLVAVADSHGTVHDPDGLDPESVLERKADGRLPVHGPPIYDLVDDRRLDTVVDVTPTDLDRTEVDRRLYAACRSHDVAVVTANKAPIACDPTVPSRFDDADVPFGYEATVGGGIPVLSTLRRIAYGDRVEEIRAVVNGSTSRILSGVEDGASLDDAIAQARRDGVLESDARMDLDGWDAAAKAAILSRHVPGPAVAVDDVDRQGIRDLGVDEIRWARSKGMGIRLVAHVGPDRVRVGPASLDRSDPLVACQGSNAYRVRLADGDHVLVAGPGAGPDETATAIRRDLAALPLPERRARVTAERGPA